MNQVTEVDKVYTKAVIEKANDADFIAVASTAATDRMNEVIAVDGWDLKNFKKNPVLLWAHDHSEMAVGIATKVWIEGQGKKASLMIKGKLHDYTEKAKALKQLVEDGIIKTMSVGFRPIDMDGNTYTKQELLEVSFVNVPANQEAIITAYKSLRSAGFATKTISDLGIPVVMLEQFDSLKKEVEELKTLVKAPPSADPVGRSSSVTRQRLSMNKVIARAADKILEGEKRGLPKENRTDLVKVIKRANDKLINSQKEQINGTH